MSSGYATGQLAPDAVRRMFDRIAPVYDAMNRVMTAGLDQRWRRMTAEEVVRRGDRILDACCGTGDLAVACARAGGLVTALDFSERMLAAAREKPGAESVRWIVHDANRPFPFSEHSFDLVVSALVLEHVAELAPFFAELRRVTRDGGRVVLTAMHPAMFLRDISANFHEGEREIRPRSYEATLSQYVMGAVGAGFALVALSEHAVDEAFARRFERARKLLGWPVLFVMTLRR